MKALLAVKELTYKNVLADISFRVRQGEWLTVLGKSGSGKSTLLKLLAGLLTPTSGEILYQGCDIAQQDPIKIRQRISYCYQQPVLLGETVADNLNFPFEIRHQRPQQARILASLQAVDLPADYLDKKITQLSGGEKQRVAMIRNLLFRPPVILLDEVTAGLDLDSKAAVHHLLQKAHQQGATLIQVTHEIDEIQAAEDKFELEDGRLKDEKSNG